MQSKTATVHQSEWDARDRAYTRLFTAGISVVAAAFVGTVAYTVFGTMPSATGDLQRVRSLLTVPSLVMLAGGFIAEMLFRYRANARWILGERPADDYTPYVPKPVDARIIVLGDSEWTCSVGGYTFDVRRYRHTTGFRRGSLRSYSFAERNGRTGVLSSSIDPGIFRGRTSEQEVVLEKISEHLDAHTDYFERS